MPKSKRSKSVANGSMRRSMRKSHKKSQKKSQKKNLKQRLMGLLKRRSKKVKSKKNKKVSKKGKSSSRRSKSGKKIAVMVRVNNNKNQRGGGSVTDVELTEILKSDGVTPYDFAGKGLIGAVVHSYGSDAKDRAFSDSDSGVNDVIYNGKSYKMKIFSVSEAKAMDNNGKINFGLSRKSEINALSTTSV